MDISRHINGKDWHHSRHSLVKVIGCNSITAFYIEYPYLSEMILLSLSLSLTPFLPHTLSLIHFLCVCPGLQCLQSRGRNKPQLSRSLNAQCMCYCFFPDNTYQWCGILIMRYQVAEVNNAALFYQSVFVKQDKAYFLQLYTQSSVLTSSVSVYNSYTKLWFHETFNLSV